MSAPRLNLDKLAAETAQEMANKAKNHIETLERLVTKSLGVLQEQGVYAMMLFLFSRTSDEATVAEICIRPPLYAILRSLPLIDPSSIPKDDANAQAALAFYADHILGNLDTLLLVRDLYEQTLIYARFHAKAMKEEDKGS